jgi:hypothetical protein
MTTPRPKQIRCRDHGNVPWRFDVICCKCKRIYLGTDSDPAPETCFCGVQLLPPEGQPLRMGGKYSARPICRQCGVEHIAARATATPRIAN